jgi:hypothetical protein
MRRERLNVSDIAVCAASVGVVRKDFQALCFNKRRARHEN